MSKLSGVILATQANTINISGGNIAGDLAATSASNIGNSAIHLFGSDLSIKLVDPNHTYRSASMSQYILSGRLADGTNVTGKYAYLDNSSNPTLTINNIGIPVPAAGAITISDINDFSTINPLTSPKVTVDFFTAGASTHMVPLFSRTAAVSASGGGSSQGVFTLSSVTPGVYDLGIRTQGTLRVILPNVAIAGSTGNIPAVFLQPGDIDGNNTIDLNDLIALLNVYGATLGDGVFETQPSADLNLDGTVDLSDLISLLNNYGKSGNARQGKKPGKR